MADHVAVVTGGGRGIGAAVARRLGAEGPAVVIADPGAALDGTGAGPEPARAVAGQVLGIRGGELTIWSQPRPVARVPAPGAWTKEALGSLVHPALAGQLTPLEGEFDLLGGPPVPLEPQGAGSRGRREGT